MGSNSGMPDALEIEELRATSSSREPTNQSGLLRSRSAFFASGAAVQGPSCSHTFAPHDDHMHATDTQSKFDIAETDGNIKIVFEESVTKRTLSKDDAYDLYTMAMMTHNPSLRMEILNGMMESLLASLRNSSSEQVSSPSSTHDSNAYDSDAYDSNAYDSDAYDFLNLFGNAVEALATSSDFDSTFGSDSEESDSEESGDLGLAQLFNEEDEYRSSFNPSPF